MTVEAASPALIEKTRTAVTDSSGQYRIVSLSPGIYTVTFSLPGFSTVRRDGIEISGNFTATINGDLKVGALEETITVSGASPLVDVQSLTRQTVFTREVLDALPASHNIQSAAVMIPGVTVSGLVGQTGRDVGGTSKLQQPSLVFRGTELSITRWDGFHLSNLTVSGAGGGTSFYVNDAAAQEVAYASGADSADMSHPGLYVDLVPKDGGNRFSGYVFGDFTYDGWSASNLSQDLRDRGITNVSIVHRNYDFNPGVGGPIRRDSLWFYGAFRYEGHDATVVDSYYDKNPAPYLYEADLDRPAHDSGTIPNESFRLTWQASQKDKAQFWLTNQNKSRELYGVNADITPDAAGLQRTRYAMPVTLRWTRTQTNRLLLEGGFAIAAGAFDNGYQASVTTSYDRETIQNTPIYRDHRPGEQQELRRGGRLQRGDLEPEGRPGQRHLRDRRPRLQGGLRRRQRRNAATELEHRRPADDVQQRLSAVGHAGAAAGYPGRRLLPRFRAVRPGALDAQARHLHRRPSLRLLRGPRRRRLSPAEPLERTAVLRRLRADGLEGPVAARGRRLRSVRQRQDRAQGQFRPLRRAAGDGNTGRQQPAEHDRRHRHAELAGFEPRLHDLQRRRIGAVGRARADEQRQFRQADSDHGDARSPHAQRLELPRRDLGVAGRRAA